MGITRCRGARFHESERRDSPRFLRSRRAHRREAQLLASLNHPNIAAIYGLEEANGSLFLVLGLVEGETLAQRLGGVGRALSGPPGALGGVGRALSGPPTTRSSPAEAGRHVQSGSGLPVTEALTIARQIADALQSCR